MSVVRGPRVWLGVLPLAALLAALTPAWLSPGNVDDVTLAVSRGALAAAASLALAVGRPSLGVAAVGGVAGYASGYVAMRGWAVPLAMALGVGLAALTSVGLGVVGSRLRAAGFVALTLVAALAGGALVAALPDALGGASGLQPVPAFAVPLPGGDSLQFGEAGTLHVTLLLVTAVVVVCGVVLLALPGARWRAIGGDWVRSRDAGLRPTRGRLAALAVSGAVAGVGGVMAVHATGVATPSSFSVDAAVLPLLAALLAGRGGPAAAALIGAVTGAVGLRVLPALGWTGPPGAEALATGVLAAVTLLALAGALGWQAPWVAWWRRARGDEATMEEAAADAEEAGALQGLPWPPMWPVWGPAGLVVDGLAVTPEPGAAPLARLSMAVPPGAVQGLVGPNGAGKSTALRLIAAALRSGDDGAVWLGAGAAVGARVATLPQQGGGWPTCTVGETLRLAARTGGLSGDDARFAAQDWVDLFGLDAVWDTPCERLSHGVRRRVEMARVLLLRPSVLLCDEPLAGLDDTDRDLALRCLRAAAASGITLVVAEHDRASLGRIATDTTELVRLDLDAAPPDRTTSAPDAHGPAPGEAPA